MKTKNCKRCGRQFSGDTLAFCDPCVSEMAAEDWMDRQEAMERKPVIWTAFAVLLAFGAAVGVIYVLLSLFLRLVRAI